MREGVLSKENFVDFYQEMRKNYVSSFFSKVYVKNESWLDYSRNHTREDKLPLQDQLICPSTLYCNKCQAYVTRTKVNTHFSTKEDLFSFLQVEG